MKKIFFLFSLAAAALLTACEKEVTNIKLPESDSKLVVTSFISPHDTAVHVRVTRSVSSIGYQKPTWEPVADAMVRLSDETQTVSLAYDALAGSYFIERMQFPIVAGTTYTLRVTSSDGEQAEATTTVPAALDVPLTVTLDSAASPNAPQKEYSLRISWPDPAGPINYYRVAGEVTREFKRVPDNGPYPLYAAPVIWNGEEVVEDKGQDGALLYSPKGTLWGLGSDPFTTPSLHVYLLHTDQAYYEYYRSLRTATRSQDNPFAEPVLVYSNITGGLGVFASFTRTTAVVQLN